MSGIRFCTITVSWISDTDLSHLATDADATVKRPKKGRLTPPPFWLPRWGSRDSTKFALGTMSKHLNIQIACFLMVFGMLSSLASAQVPPADSDVFPTWSSRDGTLHGGRPFAPDPPHEMTPALADNAAALESVTPWFSSLLVCEPQQMLPIDACLVYVACD